MKYFTNIDSLSHSSFRRFFHVPLPAMSTPPPKKNDFPLSKIHFLWCIFKARLLWRRALFIQYFWKNTSFHLITNEVLFLFFYSSHFPTYFLLNNKKKKACSKNIKNWIFPFGMGLRNYCQRHQCLTRPFFSVLSLLYLTVWTPN